MLDARGEHLGDLQLRLEDRPEAAEEAPAHLLHGLSERLSAAATSSPEARELLEALVGGEALPLGVVGGQLSACVRSARGDDVVTRASGPACVLRLAEGTSPLRVELIFVTQASKRRKFRTPCL